MQIKIAKKIKYFNDQIAIYTQAINENESLHENYTAEINIIDDMVVSLGFYGATRSELGFREALLKERTLWFENILDANPDNKRTKLAIERAEKELKNLHKEMHIIDDKINKILNA